MKILQLAHSFPTHNIAGVEVYTYNLCKELSLNHEVHVFHRINEPNRREYEVRYHCEQGLHIHTINNTFKHCYSFEELYINSDIEEAFMSVVEKINPDIVHIQHLIFLSAGIIKRLKERAIPMIFSLHDYWLICPQWHYLQNGLTPCTKSNESTCLECLGSWLYIRKSSKKIYNTLKAFFPQRLIKRIKNYYGLFAKKLINSNNAIHMLQERTEYMKEICGDIDLFISPSMFMKKKFVEFGIPEDKIVSSSYGFDKKLFKNTASKDHNQLTFGFIGTMLPAKGLHTLLDAFSSIKEEEADLKVYGRLTPYTGFESYFKQIRRFSKNKNVYFKGDFSNGNIADILSEIDVLVVPSLWYENAPLVIQEAFLASVPVIASNIGGIPEIVDDRVNGLLFSATDTEDLQSKLRYIIDSPNVLTKFKMNMPNVKGIDLHAIELQRLCNKLIAENKICV